MGFTHLQIRSGYSLMKSSITIKKLVSKASEMGFHALALTDEAVMHGTVSFYQECVRRGIKPIIGITVRVLLEQDTDVSVVMLAKDMQGYKNLMKLSTDLQLQETDVISQHDLSTYTSGVIGIVPVHELNKSSFTSLEEMELDRCVQLFKSLFLNGDFYLGVEHREDMGEDFLSLSKQLSSSQGVPAVAINDVRYLNAADSTAYDCLQAIRDGEKWTIEAEKSKFRGKHLKSLAEMEAAFGKVWPDLLENTTVIADRCQLELDFEQRMLPAYPVPDEMSAAEYLENICLAALHEKYGNTNDLVAQRLHYELNVIQTMGFSDYFLIVWDFVRFAKENEIMVGPGRGSAAGSLVSYLLGITEVDPVQYGLLFERFLNPERVSMPDIDIDFSDHRREEVIQYVQKKYGREHVAQIITFGTFAVRSLIRELIKTLEVNPQDAEFILREVAAKSSQSIPAIVKSSDRLMAYVKKSEKLQLLFKVAAKLEGLPRHISTHAAGVIISQKPLVEHVPLTRGHNETALTQYAMNELESIGLLKIDFLGLRTLTLMEKIIASVNQKEKAGLKLTDIPLNDSDTFALLQKGRTNGVFQLESQGMQKVLIDLVPNDFEDVVAVNALYRPGPMDYIPIYIRRKQGQETINYPHGDLKPILEKTYGVLVYQEQIMQIANKMAGFTLGQSDILRRAVSKKQADTLQRQQTAFVQGSINNGYSRPAAEEVFEWIVHFSNYGFNRSHAVAYSMISYQLAYLKAHFPAYFLTELLNNSANQQDKLHTYVQEAKEFGLHVLPPSINKSFGRFTVESNCIRMGFMPIKGVGGQAVREIIKARQKGPFKNLFDFCMRVPLKVVNRQVLESLILSGSFDETYGNRASLLGTIDEAMEQAELFGEFEDQSSFFEGTVNLDISYKEREDFSEVKKLAFEKEMLGLYISNHPLASHRRLLRANGYVTLPESLKLTGRIDLLSSAVIQEIKVIRTKRGESMAFLVLEDETGRAEAVVFPDLYRNVHRWLGEEMLVFIKGKVERRNERTQWLLSEIKPFTEGNLASSADKRLFIKVTDDKGESILRKLKQIAEQNPGNVPVIIYQEETKKTYQLAGDYNISLKQGSLNNLYRLFGKENIAIKQL